MGEKKTVTKFLKSEDDAKQQWLTILARSELVPIDVTYKAKCEIRKEYYPYAEFDMDCSASWSATSIWEHEEKYQEAKSVTVYIDQKSGTEHSFAGKDSDGRPYKPISKTVYETKKRTVVDNIERTSGEVGPLYLTERVNISGSPSLMWPNNFSSSDFIEVDEAYFKDYQVMPVTEFDEDVVEKAEDQALSKTKNYVKGQVPGTRYEDLSLDSFYIDSEKRHDIYLAVYHVVYEYEGEQYECFLSGGNCEDDYKVISSPVDDDIKDQSKKLEEGLSKTSIFSMKSVFLIGAFLFGTNALGLLVPSIGGPENALSLVVMLYCIARFVLMQMTHNDLKKQEEQFTTGNKFMREQVLELVGNDSIPDSEKQRMIEKWVKEHAGNVGAGHDQTEHTLELRKKQTRIVNIAGIAAGVIALIYVIIAYSTGA